MAPIDLVGDEIRHMTDFFERTKNPAAAWRVFSLARKHGRLVPEVIHAEIDRFASCIGEIVFNIESDEVARGMMFHDKDDRTHSKIFGPLAAQEPANFRAPELYEAWRNSVSRRRRLVARAAWNAG